MPDEATRAFLVATLPKLPESVMQLMLADGAVRANLGLPAGDYIRLFGHRFEKSELFRCLRDVANGRPALLVSDDGSFAIEAAELDSDGSAILISDDAGARFANAGALSDDRERRLQTFDTGIELAEMSAECERHWRAELETGPLDDRQFVALETAVEQSPEATYRRLSIEAGEGLSFDELVPDELDLFAGLLGIAPVPDTLGDYRGKWLSAVAGFDARRLSRAISLSAPFSALRGSLIVPAARELERENKLALTRHLASCADPFSMLAAVQIASSEVGDADFGAVVDGLLPQLVDRNNERLQAGATFLSSALILTTAVSARKRTLVDWPVYAKRLAWFLHASHLTRTFGNGQVDPVDMARLAGQPMLPNARIVAHCDARIVPFNLTTPFTPAHIYSLLLARLKEALEELPEADRPEPWTRLVDAALASAKKSQDAILLLVPAPFDSFDEDWTELILLPPESIAETTAQMDAGTDTEKVLSDLFKLSMAFDAEGEQREALAARIPSFVKALPDATFIPTVEATLQLAARWRIPRLSETLVDLVLNRVADAAPTDPTAPPRLFLLGAASNAEPDDWAKRAGEYASGFAYVVKSGSAIENLLIAIDLIRDIAPPLEATLAAARSFAILGRDRLPPRRPPLASTSGADDGTVVREHE